MSKDLLELQDLLDLLELTTGFPDVEPSDLVFHDVSGKDYKIAFFTPNFYNFNNESAFCEFEFSDDLTLYGLVDEERLIIYICEGFEEEVREIMEAYNEIK